MLPIRDSNPTERRPVVTLALIAANVLIFLFWQPTLRGGADAELEQQAFYWCHGLIPYEVTHQTDLADGGSGGAAALEDDYGRGRPDIGSDIQRFLQRECPSKSWLLSVFESMFLHGGWLHIAGNMLFLWIFGNNIEDRLGHVLFLLFYLAGGVAAAALQIAFAPDSAIPNVGASGAIAAVLGAYLVLHPRARVTTLLFLLFFVTWLELPAVAVLAFWFALQLINGLGGLGVDVNSGVAYWAHVGGFVFGAVIAFVFLRRPGRGTQDPAPLPPSRPDPFYE